MDRGKRSDLLAAGRKKLRQFRQKKDQKGGNKDGQSSSKGNKLEKDVNADEPTNLDPEPSTLTSTIDSDVFTTDSLDDSVTVNNADLPTVDSAQVVDQGVRDYGMDSEGLPTETPADVEGSSSPLKIDHEEARPPSLEQYKSESSGVGIQLVTSGMDEEGESIVTVSMNTDRANEETMTAEPSSGLEVSQDLAGLSSLPGVRNDDEGNSLSSSENSNTQLCGIKHEVEDHEMENSEMHADLAGSRNVEVERGKDASVPPSPTEVAQEVDTSIYHGHEDMEAQVSPGKIEASLKLDSANKKVESPAVSGKESLGTNAVETSTQQTFLREVVHVDNSSSRIEEVIFLSPREKSEGFTEEKYYPISGSTDPVSLSVISYTPNRVVNNSGFADAFEGFTRYLYITEIEKDFLQFQLDEQTELNDELCKHSSAELSKLCVLLQDTQLNNAVTSEELVQCRSELQDMSAAKEELEIRLLSRAGEFEVLNKNLLELQSNLKVSQQELVHLSADLAACRGSLETSQKENANLTTRLSLETDARKKILEEKEFLAIEKEKLALDLLEQKERLSRVLVKQNQLEYTIKETKSYFDQVAEDNLYLSTSLVLHSDKLKELEDELFQPKILSKVAKSNETDYHVEGMALVDATADYKSRKGVSPVSCRAQNNADDGQIENSSGLEVLKRHLQLSKNILQNLEKSIEGMHSHSVSLRWADGTGGASGVSKLIQAFESKQNTEISKEELQMSKAERSDDSYAITKEHTSCLRDTIKQIELEIEKAKVHMVDKRYSQTISNNFQIDYEALKQKINCLQADIGDHVDKLSNNSFRVQHLEDQFGEIEQDAHDQMGKFLSAVELLQNEINDKFSSLKQERDSLMDVISGITQKLSKYSASNISDNPDIASHVMATVDDFTKSFDTLQEKVDAANLEYNNLCNSYNDQKKLFTAVSERNELSTGQMHKMYTSLWELLNEACQSIGTLDVQMITEKNLQLLPECFETLVINLSKLLDERLLFLSKSSDLESALLTKNEEIQDLNMKYDALMKKLDQLQCAKNELDSIFWMKEEVFEEANKRCISLISKFNYYGSNEDLSAPFILAGSDDTHAFSRMNNDFFNSLLQLEALVDFYVQEHKKTVEQINLSKKYVLEANLFSEIPDDNWSLPLPALLREELIPKVSELKDQLDFLCVSYIKHEIELQFFKEYGSRMKDCLEATHSELHLKMSELEQSEQRLSSVREKLSIAVAKGKGLIVQRDNLKQSLMEKSGELDKCLHELQSKEALLQEVEAKLKTYSEVDRIEALESELSYIRNSATAMRDSFLLKDSVLQRIEEVLEDLDLPEQFHSRDIVEKIELLSKMVSANSSITMTDSDQKSSFGGSHSDAGFMVMDPWRDDSQAVQNPIFAELKSKYEQLEQKFYGLAEHNDMLEQSLVERNSLVQKWEEVLDKIHMPPQSSTLEPEDKIEWLGNVLSEVQQERDALQLKIKNLEASSAMLAVDLEESYKNLSEVSAEVAVVKSEKDILSENLKKLNFEYLELSEKVSQHDIDKDKFQREISELQEKLAEKIGEKQQFHHMENEIWRLFDLVDSSIHEPDLPRDLSAGTALNHLEGLLRKLVDEHTNLVAEKSVSKDAEEFVSEESNLPINSSSGRGDVSHDKEHELNILRFELDKATSNLNLVKEERDETIERCRSLMLEIEAAKKQQKLFEEAMTAEIEKNKSFLSQLEVMCKEKDALQTQLAQEEEKSASTREKLNIAVRKGKGLLQQRDSLKQEIEELNTIIAHLKSENNQRVELLESEKMLLINQLTDMEQNLRHNSQTLSRLLRVLDGIDIGKEIHNIDPVYKLEEIGKLYLHLQSSLISAEQEARKSKRTAELLLAELNEVQERTDILQEELGKAEAALFDISEQKNVADAATADAFRRLEEISLLHSEEKHEQNDNLVKLRSGISQIKKLFSEFAGLLANAFMRDIDLLSFMETSMESIEKQLNYNLVADLPSNYPLHEENLTSTRALSEIGSCETPEEYSTVENLAFAVQCVLECLSECNELKTKIHKHSFSFEEQARRLLKNMEFIKRKFSSQKEEYESLKGEVAKLELTIKSKENEISSVRRNLSLLCEACNNLITEIENGKSGIADNEHATLGGQFVTKSGKSPSETFGLVYVDGNTPLPTDNAIRSLVDKLFFIVRGTRSNETTELKATILELQRELQEKDVHTSTVASELVSQIRDAEAAAKRSFTELDSAKLTICSLEKQVETLEKDNRSLESRIDELRDLESSLNELNGRITSLNDELTSKDQEIETLMEALDEEEAQKEDLENTNKELNNIVEERNIALENLKSSHDKTLAKLSTTVNKFDELYNLSESLLAEVENLQSQLHSQESEISFLRQEVTRCTNELLASQEGNKKNSSEVHALLKWLDMTISRFGLTIDRTSGEDSQIHAYTEILDKSIASVMTELDDLRIKVSQQTRRILPGPSEIEPMKTEPVSAGIVTHIRSGRKFNNDQIAIAIDRENDENVINDEDDDKSHGFKSLTMSRFIPRVSRPIVDKIDGMWVSGDRLLMRQPTLRLGVLIYWVALHALLASLI
ncbi:golgin subfamily B member 1 isoform X2 [Canna indica]|uniref:Golgin subfamily B member 1 isoform X2 n=1 Tax=Canna indica TaxID=4628 RepID=A0AAQ3Q524_9LILI|nr:golgin subfamily B member 1 isoform X2 [Canna indica]